MSSEIAKAGANAAPARVDERTVCTVPMLRNLFDKALPQIQAALPSQLRGAAERLARCAITEYQRNPALLQCTGLSIIGCAIQAAQLGLEIGGPLGQAYLVPFRNGKLGATEAQFQVGYRGLIALAYRSERVQLITAQVVRAGDGFDVQLGTTPRVTHTPAWAQEPGEMVAVYAVIQYQGGTCDVEVMSAAQINAHRDRYSKSRGGDSGPWATAYEEMARKTVIRRLLKRASVSVEAARAAVLSEYDDEGVSQNLRVLAGTVASVQPATRADQLAQRFTAEEPAPGTIPGMDETTGLDALKG